MATTQVQFRKGTTTEHAQFTGANAEITVDTKKKTAVVHDGNDVGGFELQRARWERVDSNQQLQSYHLYEALRHFVHKA